MLRPHPLGLLCLTLLGLSAATVPAQVLPRTPAQEPAAAKQRPGLARRSLMVEGVERQALLYVPRETPRRRGLDPEALAAATGSPLVFVFHGHGGTARQMARKAPLHECWPEAVVVYPQGLKTPGALTDPEGKRSGWQHGPGDQDDRDLAFFDRMLDALGEELVLDPARLHATGHSNGGSFTYLLWRERGQLFASFAPSAAASGKHLRGVELAPRPVLHFGSRSDLLVRWSWQERTLEMLKRAHDCGEGEPWPPAPGVIRHESPSGAHLYVREHEGGHWMDKQLAETVTIFFQAHPRPARSAAKDLDRSHGGGDQAEQVEGEEGAQERDRDRAGLRGGGSRGTPLPHEQGQGADRQRGANGEEQGGPGSPLELMRPVGGGQIQEDQDDAGREGSRGETGERGRTVLRTERIATDHQALFPPAFNSSVLAWRCSA